MISSEIASYLMMKQLEVLSAIDLLTTLQNRNSMNNRIMQFLSGEVLLPQKYGIVFADLNGLKTVNDNAGHEAGDQLLKDASQILKVSFNDCEIYRAGGDEFMIVALGVEKSDLEERVQKIRDDSAIPGHISFAVGLYYEEAGGDIRDAMRTADANMYLDKRQFYSRFPELKVR